MFSQVITSPSCRALSAVHKGLVTYAHSDYYWYWKRNWINVCGNKIRVPQEARVPCCICSWRGLAIVFRGLFFIQANFHFKQHSTYIETNPRKHETNMVGRLKWNNSDLTVKKGETALELFVLHYQNFAPRCFAYVISVNPATTYYRCPPQQYEKCVSIFF